MADDWLAGGEPFGGRHGFLSWLGVSVESTGRDRAVLTVPARDELRNPGEGDPAPVHGGVLSTLVDTASGVVLRSTLDDPQESGLTTTDLSVSYLRPATRDLRAVAEVVRAGGSIGVADVTVTSTADDGEEKPVAVGRATYRLFRGEGR